MKTQTQLAERNSEIKFIIDLFYEKEECSHCVKQIWRTIIDPVFHIGYATSLNCRKSGPSNFDPERFIRRLRTIIDRYERRTRK